MTVSDKLMIKSRSPRPLIFIGKIEFIENLFSRFLESCIFVAASVSSRNRLHSSNHPPHQARDKIHTLARHYNVEIKAAALQFVLANPLVAAVILGASRPSRIAEDTQAIKSFIEPAFWRAMKEQGFIAPNAPTPDSQ